MGKNKKKSGAPPPKKEDTAPEPASSTASAPANPPAQPKKTFKIQSVTVTPSSKKASKAAKPAAEEKKKEPAPTQPAAKGAEPAPAAAAAAAAAEPEPAKTEKKAQAPQGAWAKPLSFDQPAAAKPQAPQGAWAKPLKVDESAPASKPAPAAAQAPAAAASAEGDSSSVRKPPSERVRDDDVETKAVMPKEAPPSQWRPITLESNHFHVTLNSDVYEYSVTFTPSLGDSPKRRVIIRKREIPSFIMMLGNVIFTGEEIPEEAIEWTAAPRDTGMSSPVNVVLGLVNHYPPGSVFPGNVFVALFQKALSTAGLRQIQRNFFDFRKKVRVGENYEVIPGVDVSITPSSTGFSLVCDVTNKVGRTGTILEMWQKQCSGDNPERKKEHFCRQMVGRVVYTNYNNRSYTVKRVDLTQNPNTLFELEDKTKISYAKYVADRYGRKISTANQPMLECVRTGNVVYLIPEFCQPTGFEEDDRRDFNLMQQITEKLFPKPRERQKMIADSVNTIAKNTPGFAKLKIDAPTQVKASMIPNPKLPPMKARDTLSFRNEEFKKGGLAMRRLLVVRRRGFDAGQLIDIVEDSLKKIGITGLRIDEMDYDFKVNADALKSRKPDFVLCVSPGKKDERAYRTIKTACTHELRIPSQVVVENNMKNPKRALTVIMNVARQMAVKLGKCPWVMPFSPCTKGTMVFGLDVCHTTTIHKSVVGMVATLDDTFGRFMSDFVVQERGKEVVEGLKPFVLKALDKYKAKRGSYPKKILFLRDGVSDGELNAVNDIEVNLLNDAIQEKCRDTKYTFVVVKKHIRTRLFNHGENPLPGTIVDSFVTHPNWYDFFLVSHETRNGTVSPTHYNVLVDEVGWPKSELQNFIYLLCYQYYNWDGSISVPAPCQYAHKMAFLYGRTLLSEHNPVPTVPAELEETLLQI